MNETQRHFVALLRADADCCRNRADRLISLSEHIIGEKGFMLLQAKHERENAEAYD